MAMLLAACQTIKPVNTSPLEPATGAHRRAQLQALDRYSIQAKLAVQYAGKGYTGRLIWQHLPQQDELDMFSPLGQKILHIHRDADSVMLTDQSGKVYQAKDVASLTGSLLGWQLPLDGLSQWILGLPSAHSLYQASYLPEGAPAQLLQDNWQIDYDAYQPTTLPPALATPVNLPTSMRLRQGDIRLKLMITDWQSRVSE